MNINVDNKMKVELGSENESENGMEIKHPNWKFKFGD